MTKIYGIFIMVLLFSGNVFAQDITMEVNFPEEMKADGITWITEWVREQPDPVNPDQKMCEGLGDKACAQKYTAILLTNKIYTYIENKKGQEAKDAVVRIPVEPGPGNDQ